jgi:hypothetical protein
LGGQLDRRGGGRPQRTLLISAEEKRRQLLAARIREQGDQPRPKVVDDEDSDRIRSLVPIESDR